MLIPVLLIKLACVVIVPVALTPVLLCVKITVNTLAAVLEFNVVTLILESLAICCIVTEPVLLQLAYKLELKILLVLATKLAVIITLPML